MLPARVLQQYIKDACAGRMKFMVFQEGHHSGDHTIDDFE